MKKYIYYAFLIMCITSVVKANDSDLFVDSTFDDMSFDFDESFANDFDTTIETPNSFDSSPVIKISDLISSRHMRKENSLSIFAGIENISSVYHLSVHPQMRFNAFKFNGHLGLPLRLPIYNADKKSFSGLWSLLPRSGDFKSLWDVQRVVRHINYGDITDLYYARLSREDPITLGQGELIKLMEPQGLYDQDYMFFYGHGEFNGGKIAAFLGPIPNMEMMGVNLRLIPFLVIAKEDFIKHLNMDIIYVNDFLAPNKSVKEGDDFVLDNESHLVKRNKGAAQGLSLGVNGSYVVNPWVSFKPYFSYNHLWLTSIKGKDDEHISSAGGGVHFGGEATVYFIPGSKKALLTTKLEARIFSSRYRPSYFGPSYMIDRISYGIDSNNPITKSEYFATHEDHAFRFGHLFEIGYAFKDMFNVFLSYENSRSFATGKYIPKLRNLHFITNFNGFKLIKLSLGFNATSISNMTKLFDLSGSRGLLSLKGQARIMPYLHVSAWAKHSFGISNDFKSDAGSQSMWLSHTAETKSLNFGLGVEFSMTI